MRKLHRWLLSITVVVALLALAVPGRAATNLLRNASFEEGYSQQDGIPELAVPNHWRLHYIDGSGFDGIADGAVARRPESVVWFVGNAPANEQSLFWRDGAFALKLFKPWAPVYFGISQDVTNLQVGQTYEFVAPVYIDIVTGYNGSTKVPPGSEPDGVGVRAGISAHGASWRNASLIDYGGFYNAGNTAPFHQSYITVVKRFTATSSSMTVWLEMYSRYGYQNNGFFMDAFSLYAVDGSPPATATPVPAGPTGTPTATPSSAAAAPAPTATPSAATVTATTNYIVRPGDTLFKISRRFSVPMTVLAQINTLTNINRIDVGDILKIPIAYGEAPSKAGAATVTPTAAATLPQTTGGNEDFDILAGATTYVVQAGDRLSTIALKTGVPFSVLRTVNKLSNPNLIYVGQVLLIPQDIRTHVVVAGDRLVNLAARYGTTIDAIVAANNLANANVVFVGQVLVIP